MGQDRPPTTDLELLRRAMAVTRYEPVARIGQGAFGEVFSANVRDAAPDLAGEDDPDQPADRPGGPRAGTMVALKVVRPRASSDAVSLERRLEHAHVVRTWEVVSVLDRLCLVMELVEGGNLRDRVAEGPLRPAEIESVFSQLLDAVAYAHGRGVVHRDLKPENILLDLKGHVKLTDFGIAELVGVDGEGEGGEGRHEGLIYSRTFRTEGEEDDEQTRAAFSASVAAGGDDGTTRRRSAPHRAGTLPYLAPEVLEGKGPIDAQVDIYSLGAILFELLTGRVPLGLELPSEMDETLDPRFDVVVKRAMARDRARRYARVSDLRADLLAILRGAAGAAAAADAASDDDGKGSGRDARASSGRAPATRRAGSGREAEVLTAEAVRARSDTVLVPAGPFTLGDDEGRPDERPARRVALRAFRIDRRPVSGAEWLVFLRETGARPPRHWVARRGSWRQREVLDLAKVDRALPVTNIAWEEAKAFADWCGARLPSEAEWEKAARGDRGSLHPWGDDPAPLARLAPRGAASASAPSPTPTARPIALPTRAEMDAALAPALAAPCGALAMVGPVWVWCADWYDRAAYSSCRDLDPRGPAKGEVRVIRGGYDPQLSGSGRATFRHYLRPDLCSPRVGVRLVREA